MAVSRFKRGGQCAALPVERHSHGLELLHPMGSLIHQQSNSIAITKVCPGAQGVIRMAFSAVFNPRHRRNSALGPAAGGPSPGVAIQEQNPQARWQFQTGHQACRSRTNHNHVPGAGGNRISGSVVVHHDKKPPESRRFSASILACF